MKGHDDMQGEAAFVPVIKQIEINSPSVFYVLRSRLYRMKLRKKSGKASRIGMKEINETESEKLPSANIRMNEGVVIVEELEPAYR